MALLALYASELSFLSDVSEDTQIPVIESYVEMQSIEFCPEIKTAVLGYAIAVTLFNPNDQKHSDKS